MKVNKNKHTDDVIKPVMSKDERHIMINSFYVYDIQASNSNSIV